MSRIYKIRKNKEHGRDPWYNGSSSQSQVPVLPSLITVEVLKCTPATHRNYGLNRTLTVQLYTR